MKLKNENSLYVLVLNVYVHMSCKKCHIFTLNSTFSTKAVSLKFMFEQTARLIWGHEDGKYTVDYTENYSI